MTEATQSKTSLRSVVEWFGTTLGQIIHEVFRGKDPETVLDRYGIDDPGKAKEYAKMRDEFLSTELMQHAQEEHRELPIRFVDGGHTLMGTVDRLVRTEGGWHIIDYKTGDVDVDEVQARADDYACQMMVYAMGVERLLGVEPEVSIYFPSCKRFADVTVDESRRGIIRLLLDMISDERFEFKECSECDKWKSKGPLSDTCPALKNLLSVGASPTQ